MFLLENECEKLMLYKDDTKSIEEADVDCMVVKYDFDNVFELTDAVIKKDVDKSLTLYNEMIKRNEEPIKIIVLLANQFRLIFQSKTLSMKGYNDMQIASELGVHPYRVKLAKEAKIKEKETLYYINLLADLDIGIKMGKINKEIGLELFLINM